MTEERQILRATGLVGAMTLLSRVTGLARDVAVSRILGAGLASDIFYYAFELPNLLRRVLGEGALSSIIVPLFTGRRKEGGDADAWRFFNRAMNAVGLLTTALTIAGMIWALEIFKLFGGFGVERSSELAAGAAEAALGRGASLTRVMFPQMITLAMGSVMMGVCHAFGVFAAPAFGSVVLNLAMIAASLAAIAAKSGPDEASVWLAWSVLAGAVIRMFVMVPALARRGWRWRPEASLADPAVRQMFGMMSVGLIGLSINHVNIAVAGIFAGYLGEGNKTFLVYSNRLIQFPMALTATALATAMLPRLSVLLLEGRMADLRDVMSFTKRLELVFIVPSAFALALLGRPIVELLFERGLWTAADTDGTYWALVFYAPALLAFGWQRVLVPLYHAQRDVATPVAAAAAGMIVNVALAAAFTFGTNLEQRGLALATTLAAFVNYAWLAHATKAKVGVDLRDATVWTTFAKCCAAAALGVGGAALGYFAIRARMGPSPSFLALAALLLPALAAAGAAYLALVRLFRVRDSDRALDLILKRFAPKKDAPRE